MYNGFIGIDPGFAGGIAVIANTNTSYESVSVWPMPVRKRTGKTEVDLTALRDLFNARFVGRNFFAALEWSPTRPGHNPQHVLRFGVEMGQLEAALACHGIPYDRLAPQKWKMYLGLPGKVDDPQSLQGAAYWEKHYPQYASLIRGPKGGILDGPLDALLIAHYLRTITMSPVGCKGGKRPPRFLGITAEWPSLDLIRKGL